jgi:hypothetical protein
MREISSRFLTRKHSQVPPESPAAAAKPDPTFMDVLFAPLFNTFECCTPLSEAQEMFDPPVPRPASVLRPASFPSRRRSPPPQTKPP